MTIRVLAATVIIPVTILLCSLSPRPVEPRFSGWDYLYMQEVRRSIKDGNPEFSAPFRKLVSDANKALNEGPWSVTFKSVIPPGGTKNDYMSMGPYWWPDTTKPGGLPYIRRDGIRNPESGIDRSQYGNMTSAVKTLTLAWFFTGDKKYARRAAYLLKVWFIDPETAMNPHLQYAQAIPGINTGRGIGIIDIRGMYTLTDAITLLELSGELKPEAKNKIRNWFGQMFTWLTESSYGKDEDNYHNNHSVAYDVIVTSIARFLGNDEYVKKKISEIPARRIDPMIEADGRQPEELIRTNAFGYSVSNLRNFFDAAETGLKVGVNIFDYKNPEGASLRTALDFLTGYIGRPDSWQWQQISGWDGTENNLGMLVRRAARNYNSKPLMELWEKTFSERLKEESELLVVPGWKQ